MKNNHIIIIGLLLWVSLPSCMVNKCRYSSGWKIDIGGGSNKTEPVKEQKARVAYKQEHSVNNSHTAMSQSTAIDTVVEATTDTAEVKQTVLEEIKKPLVKTVKKAKSIKKLIAKAKPSSLNQKPYEAQQTIATPRPHDKHGFEIVLGGLFDSLEILLYIILIAIGAAVLGILIYFLIVNPIEALYFLGLIAFLFLMMLIDGL